MHKKYILNESCMQLCWYELHRVDAPCNSHATFAHTMESPHNAIEANPNTTNF